MTRKRLMTPVLAALVAAAVIATPTAFAHEHVMVDDKYELTIGWQTEPPIVDEPNAVWVRVMGPAPKLDSGMIAPGSTYSFTFEAAGDVSYHCHPHPWMRGNVTIEEAHGHGAPQTHHVEVVDGASPADYRFVPENLTIHAGDTVVWHNNGTMQHHVMDDALMHEHDDGSLHDHGEADAAEDEEHGHGHGAMVPFKGAEKSLKVEVTIGGKSHTFDFDTVWRQDGVYVARFVPTVPGVYTVHITGKLGDSDVDVTTEIQRVESLADVTFPEKTKSAYELQRQIDKLQAELRTQAETPADTTPQPTGAGGNDVPFAGVALVLAVLAALAIFMRRR